jgi:hypothetical protein
MALTGRHSTINDLINELRSYQYHARAYFTQDGTSEVGVLLNSNECKLLVRWWEETTNAPPRRRGRRQLQPSLFGNPYKEEFERERKKIAAARGKARGATKEAIAALAERYKVTFDAMRKRIRGR